MVIVVMAVEDVLASAVSDELKTGLENVSTIVLGCVPDKNGVCMSKCSLMVRRVSLENVSLLCLIVVTW